MAQLLEGVSLNSGNDVIHRVLLELLHDTSIDTQQVARDLQAWARFEQQHPMTFWGMYQFFVAKR